MRAVPAARAQPLGTRGLFWFGLAAVALILQQAAIRYIPAGDSFVLARQVSFVATTGVVLVVAVRMRTLLGAWLVAGGIVLNCLPLLAHGGNMPVAWETIVESGAYSQITEDMHGQQVPGSKNVLLYRDEIQFEWLSDRYPLAPLRYATNIYSLGDFVIFAGVAAALLQLSFWVAGLDPMAGARRRRALRPALE